MHYLVMMCEREMHTDLCFERNKFSLHWSLSLNLKEKSVTVDHKI